MQIDAFDDVLAGKKRLPGDGQQVRQPRVKKNVVHRLRILHFVEESADATNPAGVKTARELPDGILLQHGARVSGRCDLSYKGGPKHRPPELVVVGLVDQDVVLTGKEPGKRARCEGIAPVAEQVRGPAADDEVDLQLGMAMGLGSNVTGPVPRHASVKANPNPDIINHRNKR